MIDDVVLTNTKNDMLRAILAAPIAALIAGQQVSTWPYGCRSSRTVACKLQHLSEIHQQQM
jgi:hypothetical protein